ncbi:uncharacterized protein LOC115686372 [Syzygium oleosum]|uniref:uncharacterized protein LOC115686372 n=1 Tax=Syzygium oleosum TaxID=219896 RepID=UPI0024BB4E9F|nr:uncharacterized protein LOC115686372 [Syzygium oleosum]
MNPMKLFVLLITLIALEPTHVIGFGPIESVVFDNTTGTPDTRFKQEIGGVLHRHHSAYIGDVKAEFTGILYHESAHVWQWTANGVTPTGLITGIADYIRLTSGWPSKGWVAKGSGSRWDEGYAVTAYFLEYCNGLRDGFIADLNAMMRYYYTDAFFVQLLGKSVYELWDDYKLQSAPAPALGSGC